MKKIESIDFTAGESCHISRLSLVEADKTSLKAQGCADSAMSLALGF
ncbi:hypothetical protein DES40_2390 [Litorimonas taeanensis]|uniref:Uncharacterized protein n=1 Tax=Litorimonas taeanensis TaxID=568099 RepID=A0A420WF24_9PROT|nr:hypothetical protein [Litorimonas taeanensis]RKQ69588.1 hypothetical protein DES40_2390 [Litorimonas taeanensis]